MDFLQKWPFFQLFFSGNIGHENVFYNILERKIAFLGYKNKKFKKSKNWRFWSKNAHFSNFFFFRQYRPRNVFYDILERKNAFPGYKKNKFKKSKNLHFLKEVNPCIFSKNGLFLEVFFLGNLDQQNVLCDIFPSFFGFSPKMAIFQFFFLGNIDHENVFYDILERKLPVLAIKTTSSKSRKIDIFSKELTHGFSPKMAIFPTFFFRQYRLRKCVL